MKEFTHHFFGMCDSHACDYHGYPSIIYAIAFIAICSIGSIIINNKAWKRQ